MGNEKKLQLRDGEQILWQGQSEPFALMDQGTRGKILAKWIGSVVAAVVILVVYYTMNHEKKIGVAIAVLAIAALLIVSPFMERKKIVGSRYYVTNQRAIMDLSGGDVFFINVEDIDGMKVVGDVAEKECVVIHSILFEEIYKQLRWRACHPKAVESSSEQGKVMGLVFYNLKDAQAAAAALEKSGVVKV